MKFDIPGKEKKMIKLAINGFGRIGRLAFRKVMEMDDFEVVAINDLTSPEMLAYLLKFDSVQGTYHGHEISCRDDKLIVDGKEITIYSKADAHELPWKELDIDIVLECTGFYTSKEKSQAHIDAGAKKVLISAPAGDDIKTIVYGVNHETLTADDRIVSGASCTTNCLAPMAKALNEYRELRTGFMTTIHAYTGNQKILDAPGKPGKFRRSRAAAINIVPTTTGAAKAIGNVIPELDGKLIGSSQRVPVATGSITILDATLKDMTDTVSVEGINEAMKAAADESFGYNEEQIVSTDVIGMSYGSLFDATQTLAQKCGTHIYEVRVVSWYDNEMSYVSQLIRTMAYMASLK
jgi:glyceraldehyde 3-phosphate dehydrogenase